MKITANTWPQGIGLERYKADPLAEKETTAHTGNTIPENPQEEQDASKDSLVKSASASENSNATGSSGKIKASLPDDNIGQLASELARGETKFDVLQVSSKAMRAMANIRMAAPLLEGDDKAKAEQMIRRMNRLLKRIRTKTRQLDKEEQLQKRQERAEKRKEEAKARTLSSELRNKRNKRRKEERDYAQKEVHESGKNGTESSPLPGTGTVSGTVPASVTGTAGADIAAISVPADAALAAESLSVDISV